MPRNARGTGAKEKAMKKFLTIAAALALLGAASAAHAQSGQGGYLGLNPGGQLAPAPAPAPQLGSLQGGYLGKNPGQSATPLKPTSAADYLTSAAAWCENSVEPSRCRSRATDDHAWCLQHNPARYADCRRTMDYMGWRP
jgi:hypothetical protein